MRTIEDWLADVGLDKYSGVFAEHEITVDVLADLTEADVDRLGLPTGPRRRLLVALSALAQRGHAVSADAVPATTPAPAVHAAERRLLTVMFCDLVGSTALSERLDPEDLRKLIRAYHEMVASVVVRYEGHVAQLLGDGVLAYFGWPVAHEDDAQRGVRAALDIVAAVNAMNTGHPMLVRIGIATGTVVVGELAVDASAEARLAVGETPNLAARLQGQAGPGEIVIADSTRELIGTVFEIVDLGRLQLKGITEPTQLWRVLDLQRSEGRFATSRGGIRMTPMVGRSAEIGVLLHRWQLTRRGEGQVVFIGGEPGIGKSRLTEALLEAVMASPSTVLRYQCSPYHVNAALYPFTQACEYAAGFTREDSPERKIDKMVSILVGDSRQIAEMAPLFAELMSLPTNRYPQSKLSPQKRKERTLDAIAGQIQAIAARKPVLMLFEDAHWVDPTSQEALDVLLPRISGLPVMVVVTHRPEYWTKWQRDPHVTVVGLSRLGKAEGIELVAKVTHGRNLPPVILEKILAHTDGIPLFIEELTKSILESGNLLESDDSYLLHGGLREISIPTSLRESLLARLDRLSPVKDVMQIGACIGREFTHELLSQVAGIGERELLVGLDALIDTNLVYRRGTPPHAVYTFNHALMQEAAYDSLLKSQRAQLHARIAQVLDEHMRADAVNDPGLLAHHYTQAGNLDAAVPWWREAGLHAMQRMGVREAVAQFQTGLKLASQMQPSPRRDEHELSIREPLNGAWTGLRGWAAAEVSENAMAILELTKRLGRAQTVGTGLWAIWVNTTTNGRIADSLEWANRLLAEGTHADDLELKILGHGASMITQFYLGDLIAARRHGHSILELYDPQHAERWMQLTAHDLKTLVGVWECQWTWMLGYPAKALQLGDEKDQHARQMGDAFNIAFALTLGAYAFDYRREPDLLLERAAEVEALALGHSIPFMTDVMLPQVMGLAFLRAGRLDEAVEFLRRGLDKWHARGGRSRVPYLKAALAEALAQQGQLDDALVLIDECLEQIERPGWQERSHLAEVRRLKGWMLMQLGCHAEAETCLRAAIDWARVQQAKSWELRACTTLAQLWWIQDQHESARALLAPVYAWFTEGLDTHDLLAAKVLLDRID